MEIVHEYLKLATSLDSELALAQLQGRYHIGVLEGYEKEGKFEFPGLEGHRFKVHPVNLLIFPTDIEFRRE